MKVMIYSDNGLEYCREELETIFPNITIEDSSDEDFPFGQQAEVEIKNIEVLDKILEINRHAFIWKETIDTGIGFFIDITEPPVC